MAAASKAASAGSDADAALAAAADLAAEAAAPASAPATVLASSIFSRLRAASTPRMARPLGLARVAASFCSSCCVRGVAGDMFEMLHSAAADDDDDDSGSDWPAAPAPSGVLQWLPLLLLLPLLL